MGKILVIDDEKAFCKMIAVVAGKLGHPTRSAHSFGEGLRCAETGDFDVVLLDVMLPDGNGLDLLPAIKSIPSSPEVIIMTGAGSPVGAELAIKTGAWDYMEKSASLKQMSLSLMRAMKFREEKTARKHTTVSLKRSGVIGDSPPMRACLDQVARASDSDANVLIAGETGTGKEVMARIIHENSDRQNGRFVVVDCAALPENLVESVLFGHRKGAFTGAVTDQDGLIRQADGGTLFLDEIGELPRAIQKAFLRVLQERKFRPVGGEAEMASDFRLIAATNRALTEMVREGDFREDLLFRINTFMLQLPPLRERGEDIREIAFHYAAKFCDRYEQPPKGVSEELLEKLTLYPWPGNVRELINAVEKAIIKAGDASTLLPVHLPMHIRIQTAQASLEKPCAGSAPDPAGALAGPTDFRAHMESAESEYLHNLMQITGGDIPESCRISGISRSRLYALLKKHSISRQS